MRKLLSKSVPHLLTVDQKRQRVVDSERCLELFRRNKPNCLRRYVTMDETWIHHYTPESKRSSAEWTAVGEKRPKRPKTGSPDLAPSDYYLFADLKKMLQGKRFYSNEKVITETNAYFEAKDKSFYKKGIEMLEKRWTDCVAFEGNYVDE